MCSTSAEKLEGKEFVNHLLHLRLASTRHTKIVEKLEAVRKLLVIAATNGERKVFLSKKEFADFSEEEEQQVLSGLAPLEAKVEVVTDGHECDRDCFDLGCPIDPRKHNCLKTCSMTGCPRFLPLVNSGWTICLP